ncbi:MAG: prenyltransferase [Candidatus Korarchaeota archaeon]|nr:prenyltransferase [Candidatus Korarchaeota archaeon]NIU84216.1 hypothetical protein [Candidatus Thorarchaeota archaeon]NIW14368.1 hypothetical protein [Candidatus Thorarchaeota archaeon]NIW52454.1 hypothetical protein [Candidatus Korarchaeota archaeon]
MRYLRAAWSKFTLWLREVRPAFFTCTIVPVILGTTVAWYQQEVFHLRYFLLTLVGTLFLHAGANMIDDYFDYTSGADTHPFYEEVDSPFFGGSGVLVEGALDPRSVYWAALCCFGIGGVIGLLLAWLIHWIVAVLGLIGFIFGYYHVTIFSKKGLGEFSLFLNFGLLITFGSYYVQTHHVSLAPIVASFPVGLLMACILLINGVPDKVADESVGKKTIPVRVGRKQAVNIYSTLVIGMYLFIGLAIVVDLMPFPTVLSFLLLPLAGKSILVAQHHHDQPQKFLFANLGTYLLHLFTGLALTLGYGLASIL